MKRTTRTWAALAAAGALTTGALAVPALAQEDSTPPTVQERQELREAHRARMEAAVASELGITVEELQAAHEAARSSVFLDQLDDMVEAGRLTQEEADELRAAAEAGTLDEALQELRLEHLKARLDEAVADGRITQEQADARYERAQEADGFGLGGDHRGGRGHGMRGGPRGGVGPGGGAGAGVGPGGFGDGPFGSA